MPHKAFLHKKSLLDQFKDDHKHTGIIQSMRAEHTWNNPLTRRKRTKKLNGWIKSFDGKNHIRKLSRFNTVQAHRHESILKGESAMQNESMSLKGFIENLTDKLVNKYGIGKDMVKNYLDLHTEEMQELLDDKELSLKEKALFVRDEITGGKDEAVKHTEAIMINTPIVLYKGDAENAEKAFKYLCDKIPNVKSAYFYCDVKPTGGNNYCRVGIRGPRTYAQDMFYNYSNLYNADFWNNCDANPQGWVNPQTINKYDVVTPQQESNETDEKLGYEKGHKNSRGEDAPWVIRSHEDNRILASFANKKDAEEHLKRMKQYSKDESKKSEDGSNIANMEIQVRKPGKAWGRWTVTWPEFVKTNIQDAKDHGWKEIRVINLDTNEITPYNESKKSEGLSNEQIKDAVKFSATEAGINDYITVDSDGAMSVTMALPINSDELKKVRWVIDSNDGTITEYLDTEKNLTRDFTDDESLVSMLTLLFQTSRMELRDWLPKKSEALFNKEKLEAPVKDYISDVLSDLMVSFHWGEGAERLVDKYNDIIITNYMDGDLSAYDTAKYIDGKENPSPVESKKTEYRKKQESKKNEMHLEFVDTIVVPKWLWDVHLFGKDYTETLTDEEEEIRANFEEEYGKKYYLDDEGNESYFSSRNDFDEYGGPCYEIKVYKEK